MQFVASTVERFWSIHIFAFFIILNGSEMSQRSHESTEVYLVLSLGKEGIDDPVPQWIDSKFWNPLEVFPAESPVLSFVQAGEATVEAGDLTVGKARLLLDLLELLVPQQRGGPRPTTLCESFAG